MKVLVGGREVEREGGGRIESDESGNMGKGRYMESDG